MHCNAFFLMILAVLKSIVCFSFLQLRETALSYFWPCKPFSTQLNLTFHRSNEKPDNGNWFQGGFTLLELIIAIVIFSMISTAAYKLFLSVTQAQETTQAVLDELSKLQRTEIVLEKDLLQIIRRPISNERGQLEPALKAPGNGGMLLEFTRSGWQNPRNEVRSTLQRVAYALEENQFIRYYWPQLDRTSASTPIRQVVISGINSMSIRFSEDQKNWVSSWPHQKGLRLPQENVAEVPMAIEITMIHDTLGSIVTIVPLITYKTDQKDNVKDPGGNDPNSAPNIFQPRHTEGFNDY